MTGPREKRVTGTSLPRAAAVEGAAPFPKAHNSEYGVWYPPEGRDPALRSVQVLGKKGCGHVRAAEEEAAAVLLAEVAQPGEEGAMAVLLDGLTPWQVEQEGQVEELGG